MRLLDDDQDLPAQINILPMIDVIFSILAFFIISSIYLIRSEGLPVNLPQATSSQSQQKTEVTVTVDEQGKIALNSEPIQVEQLETEVRKFLNPSQPLLVVLNADEAVEHGKVVAVMDQISRIKEAKLAIATKKPPSNSQ